MKWHPLRLTTPFQSYISGGRAIAERLGKADLPSWQIAETWEVSDVDGFGAIVRDGPLSGHTIRQLAMDYPDDLMGRQWRGPHFPLLTKFIDGAGMLPVHLHADDEAARRLEGAPNGKTEAWHILDAAPGATALVGLRERVDRATLREALLRQDYDSVMRRLPVRAGETIHMPGGTLHSFGPNTLIYEIQQTSNIGQHATPYTMDGSWLDPETWHSNIDMLLEELKPDSRPTPHPGLRVRAGDDIDRTFCCASPYFALERWRAGNVAPMRHIRNGGDRQQSGRSGDGHERELVERPGKGGDAASPGLSRRHGDHRPGGCPRRLSAGPGEGCPDATGQRRVRPGGDRIAR